MDFDAITVALENYKPTNELKTFVKTSAQQSNSLIAEVSGLRLLQKGLAEENSQLAIPTIVNLETGRLELEFIDSVSATAKQMGQLGTGLALLHTTPSSRVGFQEDNFIGLSPQPNGWSNNWGEFFLNNRLNFQVSKIASKTLRLKYQQRLKDHQSLLVDFLNSHCQRFNLLHGDLWSGNVLFDATRVWLIDPAVYYGDNEVDIAMTEMFGGFSIDFYTAYQKLIPLSVQYQQKKCIYNLYHYLNHLNLFGESYLAGCEQGFAEIERL